MLFGWEGSPMLQWGMWLGLVIFFSYFFYSMIRGLRNQNLLGQYERAWWNNRIVCGSIVAVFIVEVILAFSSTFTTIFFVDVIIPRNLGLRNPAAGQPVLLLGVSFLNSFILSYVLLVTVLSMKISKNRIWLANHFNVCLALLAALLMALKIWGVYIGNKYAG